MSDRFTDRLSDYLDGELTPAEHAEVAAHLRECVACAQALAELREVVARSGSLADQPPAADLWPDIAARIGASGVEVGVRAGAGTGVGAGISRPNRERRRI